MNQKPGAGGCQNAGVQIIVSKWDIAYQQPSVELFDVTDAMVNLFEPDAETLNIIDEIRAKAPVATEVLKQHKH